MVPIVYGFPNAETIRRSERGEIHIGGCFVSPDNPRFRCRHCDEQSQQE
jgi:hypothetical protein